MEIGVCIKTDELALAKQAGFDFAELSGMELARMSESQTKDLFRQAQKLGIPVRAVNMYCDQTLFNVNEEPDRKRIMEYADAVCRRMEILGADRIGVGSPACRKRSEDVDPALALERLMCFFTWTAQAAEAYHITVMLEPVNRFFCNTVNTAAEGKRLVQMAQISNLAMLLDFCHAKLMQESERDLADVVDVTAHVHIGHQNTEDPSRDFLSQQDAADLEEEIAILLSAGYRGAISMEAGGKTDLLEGLTRSCRCAKEALARVLSRQAA